MPSKRTTNYNLCQWEPDDKVLRADFNADNLAIDAAIKAVDVRVDGKASQTDLNSLKNTVTALQNTVSQKQNAASAVKITTGSYVGDGAYGEKNPKTLTFDKLPELLIVRGNIGTNGSALVLIRGMTSTPSNLAGGYSSGTEVEAVWNAAAGTVTWYAKNDTSQFNHSGQTYYYFAIG